MMENQENTGTPRIGKFIDPLLDYSFKRIFSGDTNKQNLIELLNDLLAGEKQIKDLVYMPTEELGDNSDLRRIIFDLKCLGDKGEIFLIEMQRLDHRNFRDRTVFSTSRIISNHYAQGDDYRKTALPEVYFIGILEFRMDQDEQERYIRRVDLAERETGRIYYNKLKYIFLELPNFAKGDDEIRTDMDQWFWLFKYLSGADRLPAFMKKKVFKRIFNIAEIASLTTEELMAYNASIQAKWDWENAVSLVEERAVEKAMEQERAKTAELLKQERAKAAKLLKEERTKAKEKLAKAEADKLATAKSIKEMGILTDQQLADKFNLPLAVVEGL